MRKSNKGTAGGAVFLDRDGTINEDTGYLSKPDDIVLIKGATEAIRRLNVEGVKVIVVSNQSGVGRGYFTEKDLAGINKRLTDILASNGARLDGIYYCPHHPEDNCGCRKPRAGLLKKASLEHSIDLSRSYVVGDKKTDIEMARNAGSKGVLVMTGYGGEELKAMPVPPDCAAEDILEAVEWIIDDLKAGGKGDGRRTRQGPRK